MIDWSIDWLVYLYFHNEKNPAVNFYNFHQTLPFPTYILIETPQLPAKYVLSLITRAEIEQYSDKQLNKHVLHNAHFGEWPDYNAR